MFHSGLAAVRCAKRANGKWNTHHNFVYLCRFPVDSNLAVRWQMDGCIKINCSLWYREHRSCILLAQKSPKFCWYQYFWLSSFTYTRRTFYLDSYCAILACRCAAGTCDMLCCRATGVGGCVCVMNIFVEVCPDEKLLRQELPLHPESSTIMQFNKTELVTPGGTTQNTTDPINPAAPACLQSQTVIKTWAEVRVCKHKALMW